MEDNKSNAICFIEILGAFHAKSSIKDPFQFCLSDCLNKYLSDAHELTQFHRWRAMCNVAIEFKAFISISRVLPGNQITCANNNYIFSVKN